MTKIPRKGAKRRPSDDYKMENRRKEEVKKLEKKNQT